MTRTCRGVRGAFNTGRLGLHRSNRVRAAGGETRSPEGGLIGEGTSPCSTTALALTKRVRDGAAATASVKDARRLEQRVLAAISTIFPRYITATPVPMCRPHPGRAIRTGGRGPSLLHGHHQIGTSAAPKRSSADTGHPHDDRRIERERTCDPEPRRCRRKTRMGASSRRPRRPTLIEHSSANALSRSPGVISE